MSETQQCLFNCDECNPKSYLTITDHFDWPPCVQLANTIVWLLKAEYRSYDDGISFPRTDLLLEYALGFRAGEFEQHIIDLCDDRMRWYDCGRLWAIEVIRPIESFEFTSVSDEAFKAFFAPENLRPVWLDTPYAKAALAIEANGGPSAIDAFKAVIKDLESQRKVLAPLPIP